MTALNNMLSDGAVRKHPATAVMDLRVAAALSRVSLLIEFEAMEALEGLSAPEDAIDAQSEAFNQAQLRNWLAEHAERAAIRRLEAVQSRGAWPFDATRWSAWLKLELEADLTAPDGEMIGWAGAHRWFQSELSDIEPGKYDEAMRCFGRLLDNAFGLCPFDAARFERACMMELQLVEVQRSAATAPFAMAARLGEMLERVGCSDLAAALLVAKRYGWADGAGAVDEAHAKGEVPPYILGGACNSKCLASSEG